MIPYKGRETWPGMRVGVYRNLHNKSYSVQALEGPDKGRIVAHCTSLVLRNVEFRVSQAGQARVRETGTKNVHAKVVGEISSMMFFVSSADPDTIRVAYYNPYQVDTFVHEDTMQPVTSAPMAYLSPSFTVQTSDIYKKEGETA